MGKNINIHNVIFPLIDIFFHFNLLKSEMPKNPKIERTSSMLLFTISKKLYNFSSIYFVRPNGNIKTVFISFATSILYKLLNPILQFYIINFTSGSMWEFI